MNKVHKRLVSMLLVALLAAGNAVMPVSAAQHDHYDVIESKSYVTESSQTIGTSIKPFTSTADLIKDTINDLLENGESVTTVSDNSELEEMVIEKSDLSLDEVLSGLGMSFFANRKTGYIDTEKYHFTKEEMSEVLARALSRFYLSDTVDYTFDVGANKEVVGINFTLNDTFAVALDDIAESGAGESSEPMLMSVEEEETEAAGGQMTTYSLRSSSNAVALASEDVETTHTHTYETQYVWVEEISETETGYHCYVIDKVCAECNVLAEDATVELEIATKTDEGSWTAAEQTFTPVTDEHTHEYVAGDENSVVYWEGDDTNGYTAVFVATDCAAEGDCGVSEVVKDEDVYTASTTAEDGTVTYTASVAEDGADVVVGVKTVTPTSEGGTTEPETPAHNYSATFNWTSSYTYNDDADGDGEPDMSLVYAPDYSSENTYGIIDGTYNSKVGIGVSVTRKLVWTCDTATLTCTDEGCEAETLTVAATPGDMVFVTTTDQIEAGVTYVIAVDSASENANVVEVYGPINQTPMAAFINCYVMPVTYSADGTNTATEYVNISKMNLNIHYSEMSAFNGANADYFGVSAPYWTDKNTDATPLGAIKSLCNMETTAYVPDYNMDYMVEMLTQAFMSYVYSYGDMLLYMVEDAKAAVADDDLTDIQKMLVLHDWLAKNASFDMNSLVAQKSGESEGSDPITMTPFGTLLYSQLGIDGSVCLGYAATYLYLMQNVFEDNYKNDDGSWMKTEDAEHIVDFVQIRFHADVAESSVAGGDSGFGTDSIFNEPHYFNAVRLSQEDHALSDSTDTPLDAEGNCWYYTDACYDDISVEVISQYRVETDGNISHMYMLNSPQTFIGQFEDNCDYFDSAYDGKEYYREQQTDEEGTPLYDETGAPVYVTREDDGLTQWYVRDTDAEIAYNDEQFEQTWFSNATGEIVYDDENWYYVEGQANSYSSMKDMFENEDGDMEFDSDMMDIMSQFQDDADSADKLKYRPRDAVDHDRPTPKEDDDSSYETENGTSYSMDTYDDMHAVVMFHYGYGEAGPEKEEYSDNYEGAFFDLVEEDIAYNDQYPDLNHSMAVYDTDDDGSIDKIYFNLSNRIMVYDLEGEYATEDERVSQLKEYNVVEAYTNGKPFTGMSFFTEGSVVTEVDEYSFTVVDHPISSISINDFIYWTDEDGDSYIDTRNVMPVMYVSIGTNYSNSYTVEDSEGEKLPYQKEAVNFNPDYYRFMDEDTEDDENTNTEFMWCANVVDAMPMEGILGELEAGDYVEVTVAATCNDKSFTDERTPTYGLSDGSAKTEIAKTQINHHYFHDENEGGYVCFRCNLYKSDDTIESDTVYEAVLHENCVLKTSTEEWNWSEDSTECTHVIMNCSVEDCPENEVHTCTVASVTDETTGNTTYTATCDECDTADEVEVHVHVYGDPVCEWSEDGTSCTATFTCDLCEEGTEGKVETVDVEADDITTETAEDGTVTYTATFTFNGETYTETKVVAPACEHTLVKTDAVEATCIAEGAEAYWTCELCGKMFSDEEGTVEIEAVVVTEKNPDNHIGETEVRDTKEATETEEGYTGDTYCLDCGNMIGAGTTIPVTAHVHGTMTHTAAVEATCAAEGNVEYWTCPDCGKNYADEEGTELLDTVVTSKNPDNHTGETVVKNAVDATETEEGYTGDTYCLGCDTVLEEGEVIPKLEEVEPVEITVSDAVSRAGRTADITISISNIPTSGISSLDLALTYDTTKLALVEAIDGDILGNDIYSSSYSEVPYKLIWSNDGVYTDEGVITTLTFEVLSDVVDDNIAITVECVECIDVNREIVAVNVVNGNIRTYLAGDVNGDGRISIMDPQALRQSIAGWDVEIVEIAADVNGDGRISQADAQLILQYLAGWDVEFKQKYLNKKF